MPTMMSQFTPLDKIRCGYFGVEHKVKEKRPRGKLRIAKLILCASQTEARRILNEYRNTVLSLGKHQNILNIKDAFLHRQQGSVYLCSVGKFCETETLNSFLLSRHSSLTEEAHKALFLQLADAVSYLHSHEISHNALTPYSVRVAESKGNAMVKLTDFGLAQICGQPDHENYELEMCRCRSLTYYLPPEANEADWCNDFAKPNTAADVFMLGLMFNAIAVHSVLPQSPGQKEKKLEDIVASFLEFPGYGPVPIGKFMHENPSVDLDHQLYRRLSSQLRRLIRRMVFLEVDGRPPITGVLQMLEPIDTLVRRTRRSASGPLWSLDSWGESDTESSTWVPATNPKRARKPRKVPFNPSVSPIQKRFAATVLSDVPEKPVQRATGLVRRASRRVKKTSDRLRKKGSAKISS